MVDWKAMTPQEVLDALATAPKVAGPWFTVRAGKRVRRAPASGIYGSRDAGEVNRFEERYFYVVDGGHAIDCDSYEDGQAHVDDALQASGWLLA